MTAARSSTGPGAARELLLAVLYCRAGGLVQETDPRENTLRVDARWVLTPGRTLGFGRAPAGVDIPVRLVEDDGKPDVGVPRLAGRIAWRDNRWAVTNHATGATKLYLTSPDIYREITRDSGEEVLFRRRQIVTVRARGGDVEHRFTLALVPAGAPVEAGGYAPTAGGDASDGLWEVGSETTYDAASPTWDPGDCRTLAAYCYAELHGLPPRLRERGPQTLRMLQRPVDAASRKWLEKQLARLRADASRRLKINLEGERSTQNFIDYVVANRGLLGDAIRELDGAVTRRLEPGGVPAGGPPPN